MDDHQHRHLGLMKPSPIPTNGNITTCGQTGDVARIDRYRRNVRADYNRDRARPRVRTSGRRVTSSASAVAATYRLNRGSGDGCGSFSGQRRIAVMNPATALQLQNTLYYCIPSPLVDEQASSECAPGHSAAEHQCVAPPPECCSRARLHPSPSNTASSPGSTTLLALVRPAGNAAC